MHKIYYRPSIQTGVKKRLVLPRFLGTAVIVLLVLQVVVSNRLATTGIKISQVEREIQTLNEQNADLRGQIASHSSLLAIESKAKAIGFTVPVRPVYLSKEPTVAFDLR